MNLSLTKQVSSFLHIFNIWTHISKLSTGLIKYFYIDKHQYNIDELACLIPVTEDMEPDILQKQICYNSTGHSIKPVKQPPLIVNLESLSKFVCYYVLYNKFSEIMLLLLIFVSFN